MPSYGNPYLAFSKINNSHIYKYRCEESEVFIWREWNKIILLFTMDTKLSVY